jgi:hypothetical protein
MKKNLFKLIKKYKNSNVNIFLNKNRGINKNVEEGLRQYRETEDLKQNKQTTPPKNEKINFRCLWVFEIYTPNYVSNLVNGIDKLPWNKNLHIHDKKYSEIIKKSREGNYNNWYNLGWITKSEKNDILPKDVEYLHGSFFQYLPSTSILGIQFIFKDTVSNSIEKILRDEYETFVLKKERFYEFISPVIQKKNKIKNFKENTHNECYEWFRVFLPGLYSDKDTKIKFPSCEFLTLKVAKPYENKRKFSEDYVDILGLNRMHEVWFSEDFKGIFLEIPRIAESDFSSIKISGNDKEILPDIDLERDGDQNKHGIERYMESLDENLVIWVLGVLLKTYRANLYRIRDSISEVSFGNIKKATTALKNIRRKQALIDRNLPYFLNEYRARKKIYFSKRLPKFKPLEKDHYLKKDIELFDDILKISSTELDNITMEYNNVSQSISATANIILSITNEKSNKRYLILQWVMIILTISIFILSIITAIDKWPLVLNYISNFIKSFGSK